MELEQESRIKRLLIELRREARKAKGLGEKSSAHQNLRTLEHALKNGNTSLVNFIVSTYGF